MFVPVSCTSCGKPFQVPEAALGQLAPCPWCNAVVTALPVSAPLPADAMPQATAPPAPAQKPLSLDDDLPQVAKPVAPLKRPDTAAPRERERRLPTTPPPVPTIKFPIAMVLLALVVMLVGMAGTLVYRGYGRGQVSESGWKEFTAPDGSFTALMPGEPTEEDLDADHANSVGPGKRFIVNRSYSKTAVWVLYHDLDPALVAKLPTDRDRVFAAGVLQAARERERARVNGTIAKEAEIRIDSAWGIELRMDTPDGTVIAWLVLKSDGPRPRLYSFGVLAKDITPQSVPCSKLFHSFRVND